ncbi:MAG TPA: AAA family ATPase, partial [Candidatus Thermoplasmatota archaeon]|nr:AAA family ATPase [Candidatus Thermoplasmatota archaeon]
MHLREVQMENFKSFGRKLTVPFEPGFTGITGPNGSGKSNIGDAILFVLGPNSPRAIRAGRLSDLVFNGGEKGKGADHCEVSLVFDNRDRVLPVESDVVTLTRRVRLNPSKAEPDGYYSYFYVNGRASQKKEFVDLLQHAGISADGYNITQQGDVQKIVNMTTLDRRRILDDIAGITAFDKDIAQADARKGDVLANLERIKIVLDEIGRNLAQLDKDRGAAQRYRELQDSVRRLKGLMAMARKGDLEAQVAQVNQQVAQFGEERAKLEAQLQKVQAQVKETQARFAEAEAQIKEQGGEEVQRLQGQMEGARDTMVRLEEKINFAKSELAAAAEGAVPLQEELRKVQKELERTRKAHGSCEKEAATGAEALDARKKELDDLREHISKSDSGAMQVNRDLARLKQDHEKAQLDLHEAQLELDRTAERLRTVERAVADLDLEEQAARKEADETSWGLKELKEDTQGAGKKRKEQEKSLFDLRKKQAELQKDAEELENRIRRLQRELAELRAGEEAAARAQGGYGKAVEDILDARDKGKIKGIVGTIAELGKVEKRQENAMQIAAGNRMAAVVVEDDAVAAQCIEHLKSRQSGRVTFLPLTKMVPGRPRAQALMRAKAEGSLGFAIDLIKFNERYRNAFFFVFGDTLVVDTMANGRKMMGGVRLVTLDGELFEASGAMTGGTTGKKGKGDEEPSFAGGDRARIDTLLEEVTAAEKAQAETLARLASLRSEADATTAALAAQGHHAAGGEDRAKEAERKLTALKERLGMLEETLEARRKEQRELEKT